MPLSRSDFLKGLLSSIGMGALPSHSLFAAQVGWTPPSCPNLTFGVISDTHLRTRRGASTKPGGNWPNKYLRAAFQYFHGINVDAVAILGDMAHRGQVAELQYHANVWKEVFTDNKAKDGRKVEKLFVTGNHDIDGDKYGDFVAKKYPNPAVRAKYVLSTDIKSHWERIWGEKYENVWHKEVKGYHFFGRHWGASHVDFANLINSSAKSCNLDQGHKPFFMFQHRRPYADLRNLVCRHRNALAFFGHNHWSIANWNVVSHYGNGFTAIQCGSCEPRGCKGVGPDAYITKAKIVPSDQMGLARQGYIVRIYDNMLVIERREFAIGGSYGTNWIMPLGKNGVHPLSGNELRKVIGTPQFRSDAKVEVTAIKKFIDENKKVEKSFVELKIPLPDANKDSRVYAYEVNLKGDGGASRLMAIYACGTNLGIGHEPNGGITQMHIPVEELPRGNNLEVIVTPLTSLGTRGKAISRRMSKRSLLSVS